MAGSCWIREPDGRGDLRRFCGFAASGGDQFANTMTCDTFRGVGSLLHQTVCMGRVDCRQGGDARTDLFRRRTLGSALRNSMYARRRQGKKMMSPSFRLSCKPNGRQAATPAVFSRRLKEASFFCGQACRSGDLGWPPGLDPGVASARINRYETGLHEPGHQMERLVAQTLKVPHPYFHCEDDQLAWLILRFDAMSNRQRSELLKQLGSDV
jgi:hypothetical protein